MTRKALVCCFCFAMLLSLSGVVAAGTYSLAMLLEEGYKNSLQIRSIETEMKRADAQKKEYYGKAFPQIDLSLNYQHAFNLPKGPAGSTVSLLQENGINPVSQEGAFIVGSVLDNLLRNLEAKSNTASIGIGIRQPIFSQGKVWLGLKVNELFARSLLCKWQDAKMHTRASITKLFYAVLLSQKNEDVQKKAVALAVEAHKLSVLRLRSGTGTELDTLNSRLFRQNREIDMEEATKGKRIALDGLIKATGIQEEADSLNITGDFPIDTFTITIERALELLYIQNKVVTQLKTNQEIQDLVIKLAWTDYLPYVYCGATIGKVQQFQNGKDFGSSQNPWRDNQNIYLGLTWTLFDGNQRYQKLSQTRADAAIVEYSRELSLQGFELSVRNAWEEMLSARRKLSQMEDLVRVAEKAYSISKKSYELGSITMIQLQSSEQEMNKANLSRNSAQFDLHKAIIEMEMLIGTYIFD